MTKPGPKRKEGARYPSGRLKNTDDGPTPELILRRAEVVPITVAKTPDAGRALGALYLRADITWAQMQAGEKLRQSWFRWRALKGVPPRSQTTPGIRGISSQEPEIDDVIKARQEYEERLNVCLYATQYTEFTRAVLDTLCLEDMIPPAVLQIGSVPDRVREAIRQSLGALAKHLRIEDRV